MGAACNVRPFDFDWFDSFRRAFWELGSVIRCLPAFVFEMFQARTINAEHKDLIHDVAYDFYGRRMATCSSDQSVKVRHDRFDISYAYLIVYCVFQVFDLDENDEWHCTADWKTHAGSVWKVNWAHPEFGQILATCSFDRTAAIWEEIGM